MPNTEKEVIKDIQNYFRCIKAYRKKHGLPPVKYIYVVECKNGRWHWHGIMSAIDRDVAENYGNTEIIQTLIAFSQQSRRAARRSQDTSLKSLWVKGVGTVLLI